MTTTCPATVITAHNNADYDALAAMVAAKYLYPEAVLIAPGHQERQGEHFFSDSISYMFGLRQPKDVDFSCVRTLVVVDTRQRSRIPQVEAVFANPDLDVHLYDHHPDSAEDLKGSVEVVKPWGSTTAIIVHMLMEKRVIPGFDEATMMGLGIYEDTGAFTYASTTAHDFLAAAWLCEHKMDIETINELISRDLTREQLQVLNSLLESAATHDIKGIPVVVAEASLDNFLGDFAVLVHKLMDMENIKVLFALARMGDRVQIVARSRMEEVDVGRICASFGGGGHSFAASASVKGKTLGEVKTELLGMLLSSVNPQMTVGEHMTSPAKTVNETDTIREAEEIMNRYGLKAVPVVAEGTVKCVGYLEQQTAARAMSHKLGDISVSEYMHRNVLTVAPEATLFPAMEIILNQRQRLVPVVSNEEVVGVLTRTDIMRLFVGDKALRIPEGNPLDSPARERNIRALLTEKLPEEHVELLAQAGKLGDSLGYSVYAVGGFVRDLLLHRPNLDIDLCVEGDGIAFAKALAGQLSGRMRAHQKFKTAVVVFRNASGEEQRIDVATARLEYYDHPGALPHVELSSIKMDLFRRDFTINAQAVQLNASRFGTLVDPFGAQRDIKERTINVLHSLSFIEDPTRILRGIRFEKRFDFRLGQQTERLIKNAMQLNMLGRLSGSRLFHEVRHVFDEQVAVECLQRMESFNILASIHPQLKLHPNKLVLLKESASVLAWYTRLYTEKKPKPWQVYLQLLCQGNKYPVVNEILDAFGFIERAKTDFLRQREGVRQTNTKLPGWKEKDGSMSGLFRLLSRLSVESVLVLMCLNAGKEEITKDLSHFLTRLHFEKPDITGEDIAAFGAAPGPLYGKVLQMVLAAKLDGHVKSKEDQLALARQIVQNEEQKRDPSFMLVETLQGRT